MFKFTNRVIVRVPHRISGFFEIVDKIDGKIIENPAQIGSRGAGFNVNAFGKTIISFKKLSRSEESKCIIYINNEEVNEGAETTYFIFKYIQKFLKSKVKVKIEHFFELPVGCGYGASGSGALGAIFGLNKLFNLNLSNFKCGKIAHIAEVINKTGLGTVCGQLGGGLCILEEAGYPCVSKQIYVPENLQIISVSFGKISTKSILSDANISNRINQAGKTALENIEQNASYTNFMKCSIKFVKQSKIIETLKLDDLKELLNELNKIDIIGASMNQLGRSVYIFCEEEKKTQVNEILTSFNSKIQKHYLKVYTGNSIIYESN